MSNPPDGRATGQNNVASRRQVLKGAGGLVVLGVTGGGLAAFLAACASPNASGTGASASLAPTAAGSLTPGSVAPSASAGLGSDATGTLSVWHYFPEGNAGDTKFLDGQTKLFNKLYPNVTVQLEYVAEQQFTEKVVAAAGTGIGPDLLVYGDDDFGQWVKAGAIGDLAPYWSSFADKQQFPAAVQVGADGKLYGVKIYVNLIALYYNKQILDAVGVTPPTTFDEFDAALGKVAASGKYVGYSLSGVPQVAEWVTWHMLSSSGFTYEAPKESDLMPPLEMLASWVAKGYVPKESAVWDQQEAMARFLVGNVAFCNNGNWRVNDLKAGAAKFPFGIVPLPKGPSGGQVYLGGEWQFLGAFSKNPELTWAYLQTSWLTKEGGLLALNEIGSIPTRADIAAEAGKDPLLQPFLTTISERGATYPPQAGVISPLEQKVGGEVSLLLSGQQDAKTTAHNIVTQVESFKPA